MHITKFVAIAFLSVIMTSFSWSPNRIQDFNYKSSVSKLIASGASETEILETWGNLVLERQLSSYTEAEALVEETDLQKLLNFRKGIEGRVVILATTPLSTYVTRFFNENLRFVPHYVDASAVALLLGDQWRDSPIEEPHQDLGRSDMDRVMNCPPSFNPPEAGEEGNPLGYYQKD